MTAKFNPPAELDRAQRKEWRRLIQAVAEAGINPEHRLAIISELARIDGRIAQLRSQEEAAPSGLPKGTAQRLLSAALTEKRRLHEAAFRGAARRVFQPRLEVPDEPVPDVSQSEEHDPLLPTDRDHAWWFAKARAAGLPEAERDAAYAAAEVEIGPEGWITQLEPDEEAAVESARVIRQNAKHGNAGQ